MYLNFDSKLGKFSKSSRNSEEAICGSAGGKNDMQRVESAPNFGDNTDRTSFNGSSAFHILDEVKDLHRQVAELSQTIGDLQKTLGTKDAHLENFQRENERLSSELKRQQRCNRNLKQQLDDERFFYQREKEHFCQEMQSTRARSYGTATKVQRREFEKVRDNLEEENKQLRDEILEKSEVTYNLCIKFLRMKDARDSLRQKLDRLLQEHLQVMAEMMEKLDEAREELNIIVSEKFQEPLPISKAKFLQIVQRNSKLVYENATLKLHIQQLTLNIEKLKGQKTKTINVDARTIEKLTECSRRRRSEEVTQIYSSLSCSTNFDKSLTLSKSASPMNCTSLDKSSNARLASSIRSKKRGKFSMGDCLESQGSDPGNFRPERRLWSAPEITQSLDFSQDPFTETPTNRIVISEESVQLRETGTNT